MIPAIPVHGCDSASGIRQSFGAGGFDSVNFLEVLGLSPFVGTNPTDELITSGLPIEDGPVREREGSPSFPCILRYDRLFRRAVVSPTLVDDFKENSVRCELGPRRLVDQLAKTCIVGALEMSHRGPLCNVNELERRVGRYRAMEPVT